MNSRPASFAASLECFSYLTAPNASLYRGIIGVFADARREFRLNLRPDEVALAMASSAVDANELDAALQQLCQWGNLESFSDQSQATTLEEFYRRHLYYQLSGAGVAALRAIELFFELVETPAALQSSALAAVADRLAELISLARRQEAEDAGPFDAAKASSLLDSLFRELGNLTEQAQEFFRGLQATVELREISVGAFMNFKERLIAYLEKFLNHVIVVRDQAETLLEFSRRDADRRDARFGRPVPRGGRTGGHRTTCRNGPAVLGEPLAGRHRMVRRVRRGNVAGG